MPDVGIHKKGEITLPELLERMRKNLGTDAGAVGCFIGVVRGISEEGEKVRSLNYQASEDAEKKLLRIAEEVERMPNIQQVMIHHVVDQLGLGEDAVYVLVAGHGRNDVFKALPEVMDRVKTEVPIWKKEITDKREYWIHELKKR